jgi:hypothetical protein
LAVLTRKLVEGLEAVPNRLQRWRMVASALANSAWIQDIKGALSIPVLVQYLHLRQQVQDRALSSAAGRVLWRWSSSGQYSASTACQTMFAGQAAILGAKEIWMVRAPSKCKCFLRLLVFDRCWTADRRRRHGLQDSASCALCAQEVETVDHLSASCVFTREVWFQILNRFGWKALTPVKPPSFASWWLGVRKRVAWPRRKVFDSVLTLVAWSIWLERNERVFRAVSMQPAQTVIGVMVELDCWCRASLVDRSSLTGELLVVCPRGRAFGEGRQVVISSFSLS